MHNNENIDWSIFKFTKLLFRKHQYLNIYMFELNKTVYHWTKNLLRFTKCLYGNH